MSIVGVVAAIILVGLAITLAIARFRSQSRLGATATRLERSQRRLSESLETLTDVIANVQYQGTWITSEVARTQISQYRYYPGLVTNLGCRYCGRGSLWQTPAVATDGQAMDANHRPLHRFGKLSHYENESNLPGFPCQLDHGDWVAGWAQDHPEAATSMFN